MFKSGVSDPEKCPKVRRPCAAMNEGYRVIAGIVIGDCSPAGTSSWLASIGITATVTTDRDVVRAADAVLLVAGGRVQPALRELRSLELDRTLVSVAERGIPLMGIDVGAHAMARMVTDGGARSGLGLLAATVLPLSEPSPHPIPNTGWAMTRRVGDASSPIPEQSGWAFYQHTHRLLAGDEDVLAMASAGDDHVVAAVGNDHILGLQFRPDRSGAYGAAVVRDWARAAIGVAA